MNTEIRLSMLEEIGAQLRAMVNKGREDMLKGATPRTHAVECLEVIFRTKRGREVGRMAFDQAIHALAGDVYHFEEFDLTDASRVEVGTI